MEHKALRVAAVITMVSSLSSLSLSLSDSLYRQCASSRIRISSVTRARYVAWWSVSELSESVSSGKGKGVSVEIESPSESLNSEIRALYELVFSLSLPLVLGFVAVLIDDCLPGLSEFKAVDYWRVG